MTRFFLAAALVVGALPAFGETEKEVSCRYQSDVVDAVQKARLDNVKERDVEKTILDSSPAWPEKFSNAIPIVTPWVYELPIKQVRENDLGDVWNELCVQQ